MPDNQEGLEILPSETVAPAEAVPSPASTEEVKPSLKEQTPPPSMKMPEWEAFSTQPVGYIEALIGRINIGAAVGEAGAPFSIRLIFKDFGAGLSGGNGGGKARRVKGEGGKEGATLIISNVDNLLAPFGTIAHQYIERAATPDAKDRVAKAMGPIILEAFKLIFREVKKQDYTKKWIIPDPSEMGTRDIDFIALEDDDAIPSDGWKDLPQAYKSVKVAIREAGESILTTSQRAPGRGGKARETLQADQAIIHQYVSQIPADRFSVVEGAIPRALASIPEEEVPAEVKAAVENVYPASEGVHHGQDEKFFQVWYVPAERKFLFENKRRTSEEIAKDLMKLYNKFPAPVSFQEFVRQLAHKAKTSDTTVVEWLGKKFKAMGDDFAQVFKKTLGMTKLAYGVAWAGPSLEQVGALVGNDQAAWASELAGQLAARFDYISYPSLEGGPSELTKVAYDFQQLDVLALSDAEKDMLSKYYEPALALAKNTLKSIFHADVEGQGLGSGLLNISSDELQLVVNEILLDLVQYWPSTTPPEEFLQEVQSKLNSVLSSAYQKGYLALPSQRVNPEDVSGGRAIPFEQETDEEEPLTAKVPTELLSHPECVGKHKVFKEGDTVHISIDADAVEPAALGKEGKVIERKDTFHQCPEHGPETVSVYLVEVAAKEGTETVWVAAEDLK